MDEPTGTPRKSDSPFDPDDEHIIHAGPEDELLRLERDLAERRAADPPPSGMKPVPVQAPASGPEFRTGDPS